MKQKIIVVYSLCNNNKAGLSSGTLEQAMIMWLYGFIIWIIKYNSGQEMNKMCTGCHGYYGFSPHYDNIFD